MAVSLTRKFHTKSIATCGKLIITALVLNNDLSGMDSYSSASLSFARLVLISFARRLMTIQYEIFGLTLKCFLLLLSVAHSTMFTKIRSAYRKKIRTIPSITPERCQELISTAIHQKLPFLAGRLGWMEGYTIGKLLTEKETPLQLREKLFLHAGVFPPTSEELSRFAKSYLHAAGQATILGLLRFPFEGWLLRSYASQAATVELGALEPFHFKKPWSAALQGKKVLVIHPFATSILKQYATVRENIFSNPSILPAFELKTIQAPQTIAGNKTDYSSWSATLTALTHQIAKEDFDVAILGCGAYGLPLGAAIKSMGKVALHLGGATQLLFGISGERWRNHPSFQKLMNEFWSPPLEEERPHGWEKIEKGCYW